MFERAERLGMIVGDMCERMTYEELLMWMSLDATRAKEREKSQRLASKGMQQSRPRRRK